MEVTQQPVNDQKPSTHYLQRNDYLRAQIGFLLHNIDNIRLNLGHLRQAVQDRLWDKVIEYRKLMRNSNGMAKWAVLWFAGCVFGFMALWAYTHQPKIVIYQAPSSISPSGDTFQILQKGTDPNHWQMRRQHYEHNALVSSLNFWTTSCDQLPFSPGETLTWLAYEDRGNCWSFSSKVLGYTFLRDSEGNVKLAPNCYWITDVLATCKGEPKW